MTEILHNTADALVIAYVLASLSDVLYCKLRDRAARRRRGAWSTR